MPGGNMRAGIDRRSVLKAIGVGALGTAGGIGITGTATADMSPDHYHNPTGPFGFGDATVVRTVDGTYYVYGTETPEDVIPIARSDDLVNWTYIGAALESQPDWRNDDAGVWAPDITSYNGEYRIYYSYSVWGSNDNPGIGLATSDTPEGPFTDQGPVFRENDLGMTNAIDADFNVVDGTPYLVWGSWNGIHSVELTGDGRDYVPGTTFHLAGDRREGGMIVEANEYYYLFYSTGRCCAGYDSTYEIEVGRSDSFFGPYYNQNGTDLRDLNEHHSGVAVLTGTDQFIGPGHNTAIQDDNDDWWMLYHVEATEERSGRTLMVDRIQWDSNDWPVIACDGIPSTQSPMPHSGTYDCGGGTIREGTYHITNVNSGKLLEVANADTSDGANVRQWADTGHPTQDWTIIDNGDSTYRIENANSGKVLDLYESSTADGANVVQWSNNGGDNQKWFIEETSSGVYRIENVNTDKVLDVYESSTADGANVVQWDYRGGDNQQWAFIPV